MDKIAVTVALLGLLTAAVAFGDNLVAAFGPKSKPPPPQEQKVTLSGTQHVVTHKSGTGEGDQITGEDDWIVTKDLMQQKVGTYEKEQVDAFANGGSGPAYENGGWELCEGPIRILNATDSTVVLGLGVPESDYYYEFGLGPGERYTTDDLQYGRYYLKDEEGRWAWRFAISKCDANGPTKTPDPYGASEFDGAP